jgi:hypothetical protein
LTINSQFNFSGVWLDNNQVKSGKMVVGVVAEAEADVGEN